MSADGQFQDQPLNDAMLALGKRAREASADLARASKTDRTLAIRAMARALKRTASDILDANRSDISAGAEKGLSPALMDRLALDEDRIDAMVGGLNAVADLNDPVGDTLEEWTRPNGLVISRVRGPLGVIGIIYESRPNVTADAGALCVRSGNAAILRCGSESRHSSTAIANALRMGLAETGLDENAIQLVPTNDRAAVGLMLQGLDGQLDVVVPRGGRSLIERVQADARVPVIGHLEGLCHTYVHADADDAMALDIVENAKLRRTGICGATETVLMDAAIAPRLLPQLVTRLTSHDCEIRGDDQARALVPNITPATEDDWRTEYLAPILSVRIVAGLPEALAHIAEYGSGHTEAIITADQTAADQFLAEVDASIVMHNASTQFADGGEFGMGAEIGIATGRIHARGPVGADQLTIFKYVVKGTGQTRP